MSGTESSSYAERLDAISQVWWKRLLRPVDPYAWNLRRQRLGRTLDVGCGIGRNLAHLAPGSVGVDHNPVAVAQVRRRNLEAYTLEEFVARDFGPEPFDSLLVSHVLEHLEVDAAKGLLEAYLPYVRPGGSVLLICPQELGFRSDATHVTWTTGQDLMELCVSVGLEPEPWRSFPLPRAAGRLFIYNEFVVRAAVPSSRSAR